MKTTAVVAPAMTRTSPGPSRPRRVRTALEVEFVRTSRSAPAAEAVAEPDAVWPSRVRRVVRAGLTYWGVPSLIPDADLVSTELVTNALRHGRSPEVGVRIHLTATHLVIEVRDGSPERPVLRHATHDEEHGRGLLLVDGIADAWGVSNDGTATWCSLPLHKEPAMEPAAATAPVSRACVLDLPSSTSAANLARLKARSHLTILGWRGSVQAAADVLSLLVDNAVRHGLAGSGQQTLKARLGITESHHLVIDVEDPNPAFPNFGPALRGEHGGGLQTAQRSGAHITWFLRQDHAGKTVRATLAPGPVEP